MASSIQRYQLRAENESSYVAIFNFTLQLLIICYLKQNFSLKVHELLFSGSQQQPYAFVAYVGVNVEQIAKRDGDNFWLVPTWCSLLVNDLTEFEHLFKDVCRRFTTTNVCQRASLRSEVNQTFHL